MYIVVNVQNMLNWNTFRIKSLFLWENCEDLVFSKENKSCLEDLKHN